MARTSRQSLEDQRLLVFERALHERWPPDQLNEKFPSVVNLNCWPTTFFIGKDGLVKAIHAGFSGPAAGRDSRGLRNETVSLVD
jgi:hypothetical protein